MIKNDEDYLIRRTYTNYGGVNMAFDLNDEELKATRIMNGTASKEELYERIAELEAIEKEHKKENGELRERIEELEKKLFDKTYKFLCDHPYIDTFDTREVIMLEQVQKDYIPKSKVKELIEKYKCFKWKCKDDEYWANRIIIGFVELLEERN